MKFERTILIKEWNICWASGVVFQGFGGPWYRYLFRFILLFSYIIPIRSVLLTLAPCQVSGVSCFVWSVMCFFVWCDSFLFFFLVWPFPSVWCDILHTSLSLVSVCVLLFLLNINCLLASFLTLFVMHCSFLMPPAEWVTCAQCVSLGGDDLTSDFCSQNNLLWFCK